MFKRKDGREFDLVAWAENEMKHKTTRQHYEKYRQMCKDRGFAITNLDYYLPDWAAGLSRDNQAELLRRLHDSDPALNNIPLRKFDSSWFVYRALGRASGMSQAEYVCCLKHLLVYQVLGCEPEFEDGDER